MQGLGGRQQRSGGRPGGLGAGWAGPLEKEGGVRGLGIPSGCPRTSRGRKLGRVEGLWQRAWRQAMRGMPFSHLPQPASCSLHPACLLPPDTTPPSLCPKSPCPPSSLFQATSLALKSLPKASRIFRIPALPPLISTYPCVLRIPDFNFHLDPSISASPCLSLPPSRPLTAPISLCPSPAAPPLLDF